MLENISVAFNVIYVEEINNNPYAKHGAGIWIPTFAQHKSPSYGAVFIYQHHASHMGNGDDLRIKLWGYVSDTMGSRDALWYGYIIISIIKSRY